MLEAKHLIGIKYLSPQDIYTIFKQADIFKEVLQRPIKKIPSLKHITIANLFFENSTRTRVSFELAQKRLSADIINFNGSASSLSKGETLLDTVKNILAMKVDMLVIRNKFEGTCELVSKYTDATVINAGDGANEHPTQGLLDAYSLIQHLGDLTSKRIAIVGDILHSRVAMSSIYCLKKLGAEVMICAPSTLIPENIEQLGVTITYNIEEAVNWCDAANILRIQNERFQSQYFPSLREYTMAFCLNRNLLKKIKKKIVIMHPGPINRGIEITSEVADSNDSIILQQVENGVAIRMAVIYLLAQNKINK